MDFPRERVLEWKLAARVNAKWRIFLRRTNYSPKLAKMRTVLLVFLLLLRVDSLKSEATEAEKKQNATQKQTVTIGLVYQNYHRSKVYDKAFKESIKKVNNGQSSTALRRLPSKFTMAPVDCVLPRGRFFPSDVLNCLCGVMAANKVALIVFLTASEDYDESTAAAQYFLHMAAQTGIPIVAWNADNAGFTLSKPMSHFRILQLAPPIQHQVRAMLALLKRYQWARFGVVTSKMAGSGQFLKMVQEEIRAQEDRTFKLEIVHHEEIDDQLGDAHIGQRLNALKSSEARILLLHSTVEKAKRIFGIADTLGLLSANYLWIGTQSVRGWMQNVPPPTSLAPGMLSVNFHTTSNAMFPPPDDVIPTIIGLATDLFGFGLARLSANESDQRVASTANCNSSSVVAWPLGGRIYENMLASVLKRNPYHAKDGMDSFFYTFTEHGTLKDSYLTVSNLRTKRSKESPTDKDTLHWERVGEFSAGQLRMADMEWPGGKANPPQGTPDKFHIRVVTLHEPPFVIVTDLDPETGLCPGSQGAPCDWGTDNSTLPKCCTGYCVDLLNKLAADIGFTYTLYKVRDEKWGIKTEQGWNGLVQDLIAHKADMCVTSFKLNSERARDIDFSMPFLETGISIMVKIRSGVLSPTAFLEPFEYSTWIIILVVSIQGAALSIFLFEWLSPDSFDMKNYPPPGHKFSICRSYWLVWATLFSASVSTDVPRSTVSRIMSLVWAAFGISLGGIYTANLAAFMITRVQYYELSGITDDRLAHPELQNPPFRFGTVEGGNTHETMKRNWHRMHAFVERNSFFRDNISAGIESVRNEELDAFVYDAVVLDYQAGKDPNCELMTVGKWASMTGYGIGFPKNSPHVAKVNQFMLLYQQRGDLERLQNFWLTGACSSESKSQSSGSSPLGVENFLSAFFLLAVGMVLGLLCLASEYFYCHHLREPLKRIDREGWCGVISMAMGKSLSFTEAVNRVREWRRRWDEEREEEEGGEQENDDEEEGEEEEKSTVGVTVTKL